MLQLSASFTNQSVLSLRTGQPVAIARRPVFNPNNLKIEGFYCEDSFSGEELILLHQDIREVIKEGFVVNDHEVLTDPSELVRLDDIIKLNFDLVGKHVVTISKEKIGKVSDYAADTETMFVQKIYVAQSILKSFTGGSLSIDRTQVNEITNKQIIINDLLEDAKVPAAAAA